MVEAMVEYPDDAQPQPATGDREKMAHFIRKQGIFARPPGAPKKSMPQFGQNLKEEDAEDIVAYLRSRFTQATAAPTCTGRWGYAGSESIRSAGLTASGHFADLLALIGNRFTRQRRD